MNKNKRTLQFGTKCGPLNLDPHWPPFGLLLDPLWTPLLTPYFFFQKIQDPELNNLS